jgi:hypothetical protein
MRFLLVGISKAGQSTPYSNIKILDEERVDAKTISEACGLLNHLTCPEFLYWLNLIYYIMPHVEIFFNQTQKPGIGLILLTESYLQERVQFVQYRRRDAHDVSILLRYRS